MGRSLPFSLSSHDPIHAMYEPTMYRSEIQESLDRLDRSGTIEHWKYHAEHDVFGHEAWEVVFDEAFPFDDKNYYSRKGIERFLELRNEPA